ncbi:type II toxin-antitoxin system VapC family toxin [Kribbia dieselivorans]|uniref:type II toxin-antitoxin system VapC family toxin n=1 Tax=Kribbia dieselivorans TaxID=331526 RepID=UPI00083901DC|nr:type II toxin-antitoxin system VapC family toxin [Kribbia dieselivorans]
MSYLLDTNVISELRKPAHRASSAVRAWVAARTPSDLHLSVMTILEVEVGIGRLGRRDTLQADRLRTWLEDDLMGSFHGRILAIDLPVARRAAQLHVPDPRPERDALIAATAMTHGLTVVTRNVKDFDAFGLAIINPWEQAAGS